MSKQYVCNPKTGRVIQVGGRIYKEVSKNAAYKRKLSRSAKKSSKSQVKPCPPRRKKSLPKKFGEKSPKKFGWGSRTCSFWQEDLCKKGLCPKGKVCGDRRRCVTYGGKRWEESGCNNPLTIQRRRNEALAAKRRG